MAPTLRAERVMYGADKAHAADSNPAQRIGDVQITVFEIPIIGIYTPDTGAHEIIYRCLSFSGRRSLHT